METSGCLFHRLSKKNWPEKPGMNWNRFCSTTSTQIHNSTLFLKWHLFTIRASGQLGLMGWYVCFFFRGNSSLPQVTNADIAHGILQMSAMTLLHLQLQHSPHSHWRASTGKVFNFWESHKHVYYTGGLAVKSLMMIDSCFQSLWSTERLLTIQPGLIDEVIALSRTCHFF